MKTNAGRILPIAALTILLVSTIPAAYASTLTVNLNPSTKVAKVTMDSYTSIILTYPNGSQLSQFLKGANSSLNLNGTYVQNSDGVTVLQSSFHDDDEEGSATVQNMTVDFGYNAHGNATALVINKSTNITAWVTGVFTVNNGTVQADLKWRSFVVTSSMNLNMGDHTEDVNFVGPVAEQSMSDHSIAAQFFLGMFGGSRMWDRPTLNYSALNSPLSTWTQNYDSATNTTTYSKTIAGSTTISSSADINGQKYTLSVVSDPSAVVAVKGYATASGDTLTMQSSPPAAASQLVLLAAGAAVGVVVIAGIAYWTLRSRAAKAVPTQTSITS